ncbi:hypothetical protein FGO68_gene10109 [Halteria grandinella]|uniref:Uncharacterized protein n=1 Tax=Halteria grandinella TaxID=5974 RepID=A0A8J8NEE8_HALGN|nr:hypothetical protein FGO68_gene10109 [Halteria grandinella]
MGIINDGGFTQILDKDDETHTRTFIEQQQSPDKLQEDESQVEEDDILDEEEYKRLIDRKGNYVRFSNLKDGLMIKGERRLTIFNPLDPNNAQQALRFLKLPLRRMATRKLSKAGKASPGGPQNEGEEISGESNLSQSLIQEEQSGVHIVDEPQDYIFAEYNRVKIGGIKGYRFQEGQDVMQVVSMLNDINEKHVNTKRRRKNMIATDHNEVHLQEEINPGAQQSITPSIAQQQKKHKNASKAKKAQALSKILEQASKKYKSQTVEETVEKRKKKKKRAPALPPVIQSDSNQGMLMQIDLQKHIIPETSESELEEEGPKINASNYHRVQSQHDLKMMSSCRSIGYLQTLHEAEKNNNEYRTRRDSSSRNQSVLSRRTFSKIYKPTPSMKKLPEWPDQSQIPMTSKIHKGSYPDDNFDLNDDTDNDESLFSKKSDPKILRETSPVPSENIETFKTDEVLLVMMKNVQCIVQGHQSQIKLQQGDRLVVERDLKDFNLVQCTWKVDEKVLSVIVPRDALQRERDFNQPLPRADSALTNLKQVNSHHILQQQPPIYPSNFDASHQLTMMHDTFSQNNDASQDVTKPQNVMTPLQFTEQQSPIDANQRSLLKLKERRKRKEQQTMLSEISHGSQEPLRITGEATLQASAAEGQGVQLKAMARKMKKMLKVGFNE